MTSKTDAWLKKHPPPPPAPVRPTVPLGKAKPKPRPPTDFQIDDGNRLFPGYPLVPEPGANKRTDPPPPRARPPKPRTVNPRARQGSPYAARRKAGSSPYNPRTRPRMV